MDVDGVEGGGLVGSVGVLPVTPNGNNLFYYMRLIFALQSSKAHLLIFAFALTSIDFSDEQLPKAYRPMVVMECIPSTVVSDVP